MLPHLPGDPPEVRRLTTLMRRCVAQSPAHRPRLDELLSSLQQMDAALQPAPALPGATSSAAAAAAAVAARVREQRADREKQQPRQKVAPKPGGWQAKAFWF
jgi:ribosomal protein L12E/L44/L45/RPP1/RPP2